MVGTHELAGISGADSSGLRPDAITPFGAQALFAGRDLSGAYGLWVTDGYPRVKSIRQLPKRMRAAIDARAKEIIPEVMIAVA